MPSVIDRDPTTKSSDSQADDFGMAPDDTLVIVPNVIGASPYDAQMGLELRKLGVNIINQPTPGQQTAKVLYSNPPANSQVTRGTIVTIMVAVPEPVEEPSFDEQGNQVEGEQGQSVASRAKEAYDAVQNAERMAQNAERLAQLTGSGEAAAGAATTAGAAAEGAAVAGAVGEGVVAAEGAAATTVAAPVIGAILAIIILIMVLGGVALLGLYSICNKSGLSGVAARWVTGAGDYCGALTIDGGGNTPDVNDSDVTPPLSNIADAAARQQILDLAGITVNQPYPTTSLLGIQQATLNEIMSLARACSKAQNPSVIDTSNLCGVVFTGGTETTGGHAAGECSHLSGDKFDARRTTLLDNYIRTFTKYGTRSDGALLYLRPDTGALYALEKDHWDVAQPGC